MQGLIGHTGFVGSTLDRDGTFDARYNSTNFRDMAGRSFDLLVCAGISAVKWRANREPEADLAGIARLADVLATVSAREFILISTIDVYPDPAAGGDEDTVIDAAANHAYGRHRYALERWAEATFPLCRVVRLPALFGPGLRKNAIYDLIHANQVDQINPAGLFQWYPLGRLWRDIAIARAQDLRRVNLFTEPLRMAQIIARDFPGAPVGPERHPAPEYRVQTRFASLFGGTGGYVMDEARCLDAISAFVAQERAKGDAA